MKHFITKAIYFILPYFILFFLMIFFYPLEKGDLLRIGYLPEINKFYKANFERYLLDTIYYEEIKDLNYENKEYDFIVFGDSFSDQLEFGYKNHIAKKHKLLNVDGKISANPIEKLSLFLNGDFFKKVKTKYVILESVERDIVQRSLNFNKVSSVNIDSIESIYGNEQNIQDKERGYNFFSNQTFLFTYNTIKFFLLDNSSFENSVSKVKLNKKLFNYGFGDELLYYNIDYDNLKYNNKFSDVCKLNRELNILADKLDKFGVKLVVLPCPDKYDIYYDFISNKRYMIKPIFFDLMSRTNKRYLYVNSKNILKFHLNEEVQDLYFFDDTHWSPKATRIIADSLLKQIK
jgi:hypothetical protein